MRQRTGRERENRDEKERRIGEEGRRGRNERTRDSRGIKTEGKWRERKRGELKECQRRTWRKPGHGLEKRGTSQFALCAS